MQKVIYFKLLVNTSCLVTIKLLDKRYILPLVELSCGYSDLSRSFYVIKIFNFCVFLEFENKSTTLYYNLQKDLWRMRNKCDIINKDITHEII